MSAPSGAGLPADALAAIDALAVTDHLLVASDFDGTMSPIVAIPADARPDPGTLQALVELGRLPRTTVAVISGRSLDMLHTLTGLDTGAHLVGSHGMEFDTAFEAGLTDKERARLAEINRRAGLLQRRYEGVEVEQKPASTAIHYRHVVTDRHPQVLADIQDGPCAVDGAHVIVGKMVVEIAAVHTSKGIALDRLREQDGASAVVFLGDDVTDEDAFARLADSDVGVKVGPGRTAATVRVDDTDAVARFLQLLLVRRRQHLTGE